MKENELWNTVESNHGEDQVVLRIIRDQKWQGELPLNCGLTLDILSMQLYDGAEQSIELTNNEFVCLFMLDRSPHHEISREMILIQIWDNRPGAAHCLDNLLSLFRPKLRQLGWEISFDPDRQTLKLQSTPQEASPKG